MKTILILDDEQSVRQSFSDYFEDHMWQVIQAGSAEEALELLKNTKADAAIVDIRLPGMDGSDFIRKAIERKIKIAYLICTGSPEYSVPEDLQKYDYVLDTVIIKPVTDMMEMENELNALSNRITADFADE